MVALNVVPAPGSQMKTTRFNPTLAWGILKKSSKQYLQPLEMFNPALKNPVSPLH